MNGEDNVFELESQELICAGCGRDIPYGRNFLVRQRQVYCSADCRDRDRETARDKREERKDKKEY